MAWKLTNEYQQKTFKKDAVRVAAALNAAKIACELEHRILYYGHFNRHGKQKDFWVDVFLLDPRYEIVGIDMEGEGSASSDNLERDAYIKSLGITLLHFKNSTKSQSIIDLLNESFRRKELP